VAPRADIARASFRIWRMTLGDIARNSQQRDAQAAAASMVFYE
jgi:hypothetical protein